MKVICPKCQFENQADASRIVCARCATIFEARLEQRRAANPNSKRQTARLPFTGDSGQPFNQRSDGYATHIGNDFEDVLDLPHQTQTVKHQAKSASEPIFDDVFAMPDYGATASYDFSRTQSNQIALVESYPTAPPRQRETQDYAATPESEFISWPALSAGAAAKENQAIGATNSRVRLLLRDALLLIVIGLLSFLVYSLLWKQITARRESPENLTQTAQVQGLTPGPKPSIDLHSTEKAKPPVAELPRPLQTTAPMAASITRAASNSGTEIKVPPVPADASERAQPPTPPALIVETPHDGNLTLQIGSFPDQDQATARVAKLQQAGAVARVVKAELPGKGTWYRVQVGGFRSHAKAQDFGNQLRSKGAVQDFIVTTMGK